MTKSTKALLLAGASALAILACAAEANAATFMFTGGAQSFTVPVAGDYFIDVAGASGGAGAGAGGSAGGLGAEMSGDVFLAANVTYDLYVGGKGMAGSVIGGGGGGSFITQNGVGAGATPLSVAGGGGGGDYDFGGPNGPGGPGLITTQGEFGYNGGGAGGTSGNGGGAAAVTAAAGEPAYSASAEMGGLARAANCCREGPAPAAAGTAATAAAAPPATAGAAAAAIPAAAAAAGSSAHRLRQRRRRGLVPRRQLHGCRGAFRRQFRRRLYRHHAFAGRPRAVDLGHDARRLRRPWLARACAQAEDLARRLTRGLWWSLPLPWERGRGEGKRGVPPRQPGPGALAALRGRAEQGRLGPRRRLGAVDRSAGVAHAAITP